jgi:3-hydroxymyristoyl/3-hydroxydecanoyl-(acyl carrier protein) dehydratase
MSGAAGLDKTEIRKLLPWRQPFAMIDRMLECKP